MNKEKRFASRETTMQTFDPSASAANDNLFGLPFSVDESEIVIIPVPWEVTVSYREGTAQGPEAILRASRQIDLSDRINPDGWRYGIAMEAVDEVMQYKGKILREYANFCIAYHDHPHLPDAFKKVNEDSKKLNKWLEDKSCTYLRRKKLVGVVGGDHSVPLGLMQALARVHDSYGILHIDAHFDHRYQFEGFTFSHASIMRNASDIPEIDTFVHVGIRDYCKEEIQFVSRNTGRYKVFTDDTLAATEFCGTPWDRQCDYIIHELPQNVYISFDIDGLDIPYCPHTGTPVPGILTPAKIRFLLECLALSGRRIIGFDLCEVAPGSENPSQDSIDAIIGARLLYLLCLVMAKTNGLT
ncbi:MAG: agmatinase family protein [bacterium]|nr:agmatinase family protein [bacterium]